MAAGDRSSTREEAETSLAREWDAVRESVEGSPDSADDFPTREDAVPAAGTPARETHRTRLILAFLGVVLALVLTAVLLFAELGREDSLSPHRALGPRSRDRGGTSGALRWAEPLGAGKSAARSEERVARGRGGTVRKPRRVRKLAPSTSPPPSAAPQPVPSAVAPSDSGSPAPSPPTVPTEPAPAPSPPGKGGLRDGSESSTEFGL